MYLQQELVYTFLRECQRRKNKGCGDKRTRRLSLIVSKKLTRGNLEGAKTLI